MLKIKLLSITFFLISRISLFAQVEPPPVDTAKKPPAFDGVFRRGVAVDSSYKNVASGEFTPGKGFDLVRTKYGSLNFSLYAMARYLNQLPGNQTWTDHLGRQKEFVGRNDFYFHRAMLWFSGFVGTPKLTYTATVWTIMPTQQTLVYGNLQYRFNKHFKFGIGVAPNLSVRSMQGPFPFYASTDRTMGEESLRGGFTQGFFVTGEIVPKLLYTIMLGNNLSTLGIQASKETRNLSKSLTLVWMPTTGEYGPRGGISDFEYHRKAATRFGVSMVTSREDRFNNTGTPSPDNTQVRMTDGLLFFETGALADGVTVDQADYNMMSVDAGVKYRGFSAQLELYGRHLSDFAADGPVPLSSIKDYGYSLQISHMVIPKRLVLYGINSYFWDEFKRHPYEFGGGLNFYPVNSRSWRLNGQVMRVYKSSAGGTFGLYTAGQTGTTITLGTDILL
ncbi:hypothetical protein [Flavihumibacter fluvii]|uniref:hypothetical protein n=1 Tax=Flavihumibacter fluvii TaxID=2838157 RepID=UPI001BDECE43|nr:hypothetical protein [Flavihumibacter fluvii]ULQ54077.1 hypothetical protein KJS93_07060 [Flavihumibacter fluvii]